MTWEYDQGSEEVRDADGTTIADVFQTAAGPLLAAAPQLLEAAKDVLSWYERLGHVDADSLPAMGRLHNAVRKAGG